MKFLFMTVVLVMALSTAIFGQAVGSISGKVTFGDNNALHQVTVRILELRRTVVTGDDGVYRFTDIPSGTYKLVAHQEGFTDVTRTVVVASGDVVTADFRLELIGLRETVTVTASGTEQSTFESLASVSTVNSNQIAERAAVGIGEVLDKEPGVAKRSFGPGNARPVIRGFDGDRVLVSTDGIRMGSLASQSGDHSEPVDVLAAERIEVVKGPATLLYGSNAIGGVVNAISGRDEGMHPGARGYFSGIGGATNRQAAASGGVEYGIGQMMFWGNATAQRTGDYKAGGDFGTVVNSFTRAASGSLGGGYYGKRAFFNSTFSYYQNRYGIPLDISDPEAERRTLRMWRNSEKFSFGYNEPIGFVSRMKFTLDLSNYRHQELVDREVGTTFRNNVVSYRGMFEQKQAGRLSGRFGFDGFDRKYETVGDEVLVIGPVKQDSFSLFALEELKYERVTFQFGARLEKNSFAPTDRSLAKRDFTGLSAAAGFRIPLWAGGAFVTNYTHSFRSPALEELYNNGPHDGTLSFEIGDPLLKPEKSDGLDVAVRHQSGRVRGEVNIFYYGIKDFVFLAPTGVVDNDSGLEIARYLQADSRFWGSEASVDVIVHKRLDILTSFDYVNAEVNDGRPLPRIAPFRGRVGLDLHYGNLSVRPEIVAVGRQSRIFVNETPTPGYGTVNIAGSYIIPSSHLAHIFSVNAYNLNNKLFFNHISFIKDISPEIGRGVRFSYTVRFF